MTNPSWNSKSVRSKHIKDSKEHLFIMTQTTPCKFSGKSPSNRGFRLLTVLCITVRSKLCQCILHYNPCLRCLNWNTNGWELWEEKWETFSLSTHIKNLPKGSKALWPQNRNCSVTHTSLYAGRGQGKMKVNEPGKQKLKGKIHGNRQSIQLQYKAMFWPNSRPNKENPFIALNSQFLYLLHL